jgi:hypothetical protein
MALESRRPTPKRASAGHRVAQKVKTAHATLFPRPWRATWPTTLSDSAATDAAIWSRWWSGTAVTCSFSRCSTPRPAPWSPPSQQRSSGVPAATANHAPIPDLGPRRRHDPARRLHRRHRHPGLLLRRLLPWQHGSNENSNRLLRQYFPKKTDLSQHDADHVHTAVNRSTADLDRAWDGKLLMRSCGPPPLR